VWVDLWRGRKSVSVSNHIQMAVHLEKVPWSAVGLLLLIWDMKARHTDSFVDLHLTAFALRHCSGSHEQYECSASIIAYMIGKPSK
jgi:hypothetical protein